MSSSTPTPHAATPFEWLAGELLFPFARGDGSSRIDTCSDIPLLLDTMNVDLGRHIRFKESSHSAAAVETEGIESNAHGSANKDEEESTELLAARLSRLRFLLYEERRSSTRDESFRHKTPSVVSATVRVLTDSEQMQTLLPLLLAHLAELPFESRKDVASIFNYLLVCGLAGADAAIYKPFMETFGLYVESRFDEILTPIIKGHECGKPGQSAAPDVALHCGSMLRSTLRHVNLYRNLVSTTDSAERFVFPFLDDFVFSPNFDVATDATETLRLILTGGNSVGNEAAQTEMSELTAEFLIRDYQALWEERFNLKLLSSERSNYMTRRMALQILSTVLLTRSNYAVMIRYIASKSNLIVVMNLLRNPSPHISLDAFHVFKIFVANPNKPPDIIKILVDNKVKLCRYLETLHEDRALADAQFRDEKALVIATLEGLEIEPEPTLSK